MKINKPALVVSAALLVISGVFLFIDPWPQWPEYHQFADDRSWRGLPNALNVVSNIGLLLVGAWGMFLSLGRHGRIATGRVSLHYFVFFLGVFLTAFGSAYFHYEPNNHTLVWDRLPMTIMFAGFLTIVIGELMDETAARTLLLPLLIAGFASVIIWIQGEDAGAGDLRFYGLVQYLPVLLMGLLWLLYPRPPHFTSAMIGMLVFFALAKLFEEYDHQVYDALNRAVSGHTIKHLCAAIAPGFLLLMLYRRARVNASP